MNFSYLSDSGLKAYIRYYALLMPNDVIKEFLKKCKDEYNKRHI